MDKYNLVPREHEAFAERVSCICCTIISLGAEGGDMICDLCVSSCKLAQVHHEIQYRNKESAEPESMERG